MFIDHHSVCVLVKNWDSPNPYPASECALPSGPKGGGGGGTLACG
jgi:hypothetical protein